MYKEMDGENHVSSAWPFAHQFLVRVSRRLRSNWSCAQSHHAVLTFAWILLNTISLSLTTPVVAVTPRTMTMTKDLLLSVVYRHVLRCIGVYRVQSTCHNPTRANLLCTANFRAVAGRHSSNAALVKCTCVSLDAETAMLSFTRTLSRTCSLVIKC